MLLHIINKCNIILSGISSCILFVWKRNNLMFGACLEPVSALFFHFFPKIFFELYLSYVSYWDRLQAK
jgi:hypothetical protein